MNGRYELVSGERRWRAVAMIPQPAILARVCEMDDLKARRICAAENVHRDNLAPIEVIEATIDWVDACMANTDGYMEFGDTPEERVGRLLGKLRSDQCNGTDYFINKFINKIEDAFAATNRNVTWLSFLNNDLSQYARLDEDVKDVAVEKSLPKATAYALQQLKDAAPEEFEQVRQTGEIEVVPGDTRDIQEVSAKEVEKCAKRARGSVHFSSETVECYTPPEIIARAVQVMGAIDLDPCSNSKTAPNVPAEHHLTAEDDGLAHPWFGRVYMNPPYGQEIAGWVGYLCEQYETGNVEEAIALVPSRTDTQWFRRLRQYPRCFVWGRLRFGGQDNSAPFPSMVVYLGENFAAFIEAFGDIGDTYAIIAVPDG